MYLRTQRNTTSKSTYIIYFESLNSHPPVIFVNLIPIYTLCHQISLDTFYMDFSFVSRLTILFNNGLNMFTLLSCHIEFLLHTSIYLTGQFMHILAMAIKVNTRVTKTQFIFVIVYTLYEL